MYVQGESLKTCATFLTVGFETPRSPLQEEYFMRLYIAFITLIASLSACAPMPASTSKYRSGYDFNDSYHTVESNIAKAGSCTSQHYKIAQIEADLMGSKINAYYSASTNYREYSDAERRMNKERLDIGVPLHLKSLFLIGDKAAAGKWNALAVETYNKVLSKYVGDNYAGYRDRAMAALNRVK